MSYKDWKAKKYGAHRNELWMAKQADAMGLNPIPDNRVVGSIPTPETTYQFTVESRKMKGLLETECFKRPFTIKEKSVTAAWKLLDDMLWAEDMKHTKHRIICVIILA